MLKVKGIEKSFNKRKILKGIDFSIKQGEVVSIIGPSGSGKTTFLRCLNYLEQPEGGVIEFEKEQFQLNQVLSKDEVSKLRKHSNMVFQQFNLFPHLTVLENVTLALTVSQKIEKQAANEMAKELLESVGLSEHLAHYPVQLSGGQQQRVGIARALITNPDILLMDEPTSALDPLLVKDVLSVIKKLAQEEKTMIIVTHELQFAFDVSDRIVYMENGEVVEEGTSEMLLSHANDERTRAFLESYFPTK